MRYKLPKIMIGDNKHMEKLREVLCKWYCMDEQENFYADRTLRECVRDCLRNPGPYHDEAIAWEWYAEDVIRYLNAIEEATRRYEEVRNAQG